MKTLITLIVFGAILSFNWNNSESFNYQENGIASYYADFFEGRLTANGELFSQDLLTAAHKTLPFGTEVLVENLTNGKTVVVTINDRGPFIKGRIIDLSKSAASEIGMIEKGIQKVLIKANLDAYNKEPIVAVNAEQ
jgi:rare lipoprotein A